MTRLASPLRRANSRTDPIAALDPAIAMPFARPSATPANAPARRPRSTPNWKIAASGHAEARRWPGLVSQTKRSAVSNMAPMASSIVVSHVRFVGSPSNDPAMVGVAGRWLLSHHIQADHAPAVATAPIASGGSARCPRATTRTMVIQTIKNSRITAIDRKIDASGSPSC